MLRETLLRTAALLLAAAAPAGAQIERTSSAEHRADEEGGIGQEHLRNVTFVRVSPAFQDEYLLLVVEAEETWTGDEDSPENGTRVLVAPRLRPGRARA